MATSIDICNQALILIGQEPILTMDDSSKQSRLCKRLYEPTLETLLREYPWTFAIKRVILSPEVETPGFGFMHKFVLPIDCMRIVSTGLADDQFSVEGGCILCDEDTVYLRYVGKPGSANMYDSHFVQVLTNRLAKVMCQSLTADQDLFAILVRSENTALLRAMNTQAIETAPQPVHEGNWLKVRY